MDKHDMTGFIKSFGTINAPDAKKRIGTITSALVESKKLKVCNDKFYAIYRNMLHPLSDKEYHQIIRGVLAPDIRFDVSNPQVKEIGNRLCDDLDCQIDIFENYKKGEFVVNTLSGLYDIQKQCIVPSVDGYIPDYMLNFNYQPKSTLSQAPYYEKFVLRSIGEDQVKVLHQIIGSCISSLLRCRAIFFFLGAGGTGKSTILDVLESIFPPGLVSHEPLHHLGSEQAKSHFIGKRLNIGRDNTARVLRNEESLKNLASNEWTTSRELYHCSVDFIPTTKLICAGNQLPRCEHMDDALLDRFVWVIFPNSIAANDRIIDLKEKLSAERDVIFSLALDSLLELVNDNYKYGMGKQALNYLANQRSQLHSAEDYISEELEFTPEGKIAAMELYAHYKEWCTTNSVTLLGKQTFYDKLRLLHPEVIYGKIGPSNNRRNGFKGITLKNTCPSIKEE